MEKAAYRCAGSNSAILSGISGHEFKVTQHSNPLETSAGSLADKTESISGEVRNSDNFVMLGSKTVFKMSALRLVVVTVVKSM